MENRRKKYKRIRSPIGELKHLDDRGSRKRRQIITKQIREINYPRKESEDPVH